MIAEPTGTDGRPVIYKKTSVTGRHTQPLFLFHLSLFSYYSPLVQERIFEVASTGIYHLLNSNGTNDSILSSITRTSTPKRCAVSLACSTVWTIGSPGPLNEVLIRQGS